MFVCVVSVCTCAVVQASSQRPTWGICSCFEAGWAIHRPGQFAVELGVFILLFTVLCSNPTRTTASDFSSVLGVWTQILTLVYKCFGSAHSFPKSSRFRRICSDVLCVSSLLVRVRMHHVCAALWLLMIILRQSIFFVAYCRILLLLLLSTNFMLYITYSCALWWSHWSGYFSWELNLISGIN